MLYRINGFLSRLPVDPATNGMDKALVKTEDLDIAINTSF